MTVQPGDKNRIGGRRGCEPSGKPWQEHRVGPMIRVDTLTEVSQQLVNRPQGGRQLKIERFRGLRQYFEIVGGCRLETEIGLRSGHAEQYQDDDDGTSKRNRFAGRSCHTYSPWDWD